MKALLYTGFLWAILWAGAQQQASLEGYIKNGKGEPISGASIVLANDSTLGTISNSSGFFQLKVDAGRYGLIFSHIQYKDKQLKDILAGGEAISVILEPRIVQLEDVVVEGTVTYPIAGATPIDAKSAQNLPSALGDFNKVLLTLPGVTGNNELSSAYNVRGGNFDENLVYVNDIPVYRPFLANAGRQEGLSFINPSLVKNIQFYAGGWEAQYGDKLSSSLAITYKEPEKFEGQLTAGLLGGSLYFGGRAGPKVQYLLGARHSDSRYLLGTLETEGQYLPTYSDIQGFLTFDLSKGDTQINRTKLNWLLSYSRNRYLTLPVSQTTDFGTFTQNLRIQTAFEGREQLNYDTYQTGINLSHRWDQRFSSRWILSLVSTREEENYTVEGAYRVCDVNNDPSSGSFNECLVVRGIGTNYSSGRNGLSALILNSEWRNKWLPTDHMVVDFGAGYTLNDIDDELNEYAFLDSAGFVSINESTFNQLNLDAHQVTGFVQASISSKDSVHAVNVGVRTNFLSYNHELLLSPRLSYYYHPKWEKQTSFRLSAGQYSQPPFYRELRNRAGEIQTGIAAQKSAHFIASMERVFEKWKRPFLFSVEAYYKTLWDVIPYDIDNVRLRYFANNAARAYAYGLDFRIHGAFIKDTQSWFSLGILRTEEDIIEDEKGFIRRPTDQRVNVACYFEDHFPKDPSMRIYVNAVVGSGFPLGPPNDFNLRNAFSGDEYYRVDIGLSKLFEIKGNKYLKIIALKLEVLNALGADNTLSYTWIEDINGGQIAIPNSLSARFLNLKISTHF